MSVLEAAGRALEASDAGPADEATVAAMLVLAEKIDQGGSKTDRVTFSTFLSYCEALHLTPASREKLPKADKPEANPIDELLAKRNKRAGRRSA